MMSRKVLLIGYGNPGRGDDGLGPAFARRIALRRLPGLTIEIDYQLTVEHALMISAADTIIFADAALDTEDPFYFRQMDETTAQALGSHTLTPQAALSLARLLFGAAPECFILGLRGDSFGEMSEELSSTALGSLDAAEAFFLDWYQAALD